jgi:hypothetical protein
LRGTERLGQKDHRTGGETFTRQFWILFGSHHHHGNLHEPFFSLHEPHQLGARDVRHHDIKDRRQDIAILLQQFVSFLAVARADHLVPFLLQNHLDQPENGRIVVGH